MQPRYELSNYHHSQCWFCGKDVTSYNTEFQCDECEVRWCTSPWWQVYGSRSEALREREEATARWKQEYYVMEFVDFTKPGAPSCPA